MVEHIEDQAVLEAVVLEEVEQAQLDVVVQMEELTLVVEVVEVQLVQIQDLDQQDVWQVAQE